MSHTHEEPETFNDRASLTRFAWLSIAAAVITIILKATAYLLTDSVGFLSDAIESGVNLVAAVMALGMLIIAAWPPDESHAYGHSKAEYFASFAEGILILLAAGGIIYSAAGRLLHPHLPEQLGVGLTVSLSATVINLIVAQILLRTGRKRNSITLEADAQHLMADVWTSIGIVAGMAIVAVTHWNVLDPVIAILVGLNITWTGFHLMRRSVSGLMDASLPENEQQLIEDVIAKYRARGVDFHALRTRQSAARRFVSVHVLVPGAWTVHDAHHIAEDFEGDIRKVLPDTIIHTHLEPTDDILSMRDVHDK